MNKSVKVNLHNRLMIFALKKLGYTLERKRASSLEKYSLVGKKRKVVLVYEILCRREKLCIKGRETVATARDSFSYTNKPRYTTQGNKGCNMRV